MEKNADERRVMSRQSGPSKKKNLVSGNLEKEKSRREKVKRLSVVEREMGFDDEHQLHSTTLTSIKFKLPRKIFSDSNTSVPRKLRSAIRKRSCELASVPLPDAKRSNNTLKKIKQNGWSDNAQTGLVSMAISKDEEEVAETLFALAGMIPHNRVHVNDKTDNESLDAKTSNLSKKQNSDPMPSSEDHTILKEEPETTYPTPTTDRDSLQTRNMNDPASLAWSKLSERRQMNMNLKLSVPPAHFQTSPLLRVCDDRQLTNSTFYYGSTEPNLESGLKDTKQKKSQFTKRESHINIGIEDLAVSQDREHATSSECRDNVLASRPLHGSGVAGLPLQSSATKFPSWLNNSSSSKPVYCKDTLSASKVPSSINSGRKSWRRCVTHVYISRLIQVLQTSEGKDIRPSDTSQLTPSQCSSAGQVAANWDDLNGPFSGGHMFGSGAYKNICEATINGPLQLKNCKVEEEGHSLSGCCDLKKQSCDFLSLSTGAGTEENKGVNRLGVSMEAKGHVLQLQSAAQHNSYVPCSMPQNSLPSIHYRDQLAVVSAASPSMPPQVQIQGPPYFSNRCGPVALGTSTTRSTQQPHPKQQQQIWTAQLAAQLRPGHLLSSHVANWQNSTRDPNSMNHMQAHHLPATRPSLDTIGSKYLNISQQPQQQLIGLCPSLPTSNAKLQNSQLPSIREDKGGRFHPDGMLPLQLLCNERLLS